MKLKNEELLNRINTSGESYSAIARRSGVSRQAISAWLKNERYPKYQNVKAIADALGCRVEDIAVIDDSAKAAIAHEEDFARSALGVAAPKSIHSAGSDDADSNLMPMLLQYVAALLAEQISAASQSEVGRRVGLSASQINRIVHGKADLNLFPVGALCRLCPQVIERSLLLDAALTGDDCELAEEKVSINALTEKIADLQTAKTVKLMLEGLVK